MHAAEVDFTPDFSGLSVPDWRHQFRALGTEHGFHEPLGRYHGASFIDAGDTLVISFDTLPRLQKTARGMPLAFAATRAFGWSALSVTALGATWFRAPAVATFFDQLQEDGFLADFRTVLFTGSGPGAHAACSFARALPGARVLAFAPQATLDPGLAGWDDRFRRFRRLSFGGRYGHAPDGLAQAGAAHLVFDPRQRLDAMHAALFTGPAVHPLRQPFLGPDPETALRRMRLLSPLLYAAGTGALSAPTFHRLLRARHRDGPYLRRLLNHLESAERPALAAIVRRNMPR